jgi:hypothetical protein
MLEREEHLKRIDYITFIDFGEHFNDTVCKECYHFLYLSILVLGWSVALTIITRGGCNRCLRCMLVALQHQRSGQRVMAFENKN